VTLACVGVGGQGTYDLQAFLTDPRVQVVAVCDVDRAHLAHAKATVENHYAQAEGKDRYNGCFATHDYREITTRPDVDAVLVATPDHTHALITIAAVRGGKDVYCEKPLAYSVAEGRAVVQAVNAYGRVLQTGTQRRSFARMRFGCELVRNGRIGRLETVRVGLPRGFAVRGGGSLNTAAPEPVPEGFDYDLWLGPAPMVPYTPGRCHFNFRWILDYGEGYISDWGAHYLDVGQWGIGADLTGPSHVQASAVFPNDGLYDAPTDFDITYTYPDGVTMVCSSRETLGMRFEGSDGWIHLEAPGQPQLTASSESLLTTEIGPHEIHLRESVSQHLDFIDCVLSRTQPAAQAEIGHRSASICHIGMIAARLGRLLDWDPDHERFTNNNDANRLLARPMRYPWTL
jgi:predicted dehydrogenase